MNRNEFKAINTIARKMNWQQKPVSETIEAIKQMVRNQQALELDCVGECDDEEDTLLSIALWDTEKIISTLYVSDYTSLVSWNWNCLCEDFGCTSDDLKIMMEFYVLSENYLAECYEAEDEAKYDAFCDAWENSYC